MSRCNVNYFTFAMFLVILCECTIVVNSAANTLHTKLPIGMGFVEQCNENNAIYVDKTELAMKLIQSGERSSLLLRPRRYGKTFFLNTLWSILLGKTEVFNDTFIGDPQNGYDWKKHTVLRLTFVRPVDDPIKHLSHTLMKIAKDSGVDKELDGIEQNDPFYFEMLLRELSPIDSLGNIKVENKQPLALLVDEYDLPFKKSNEEIRKYFHSIFARLKTLTDESVVKFTFYTGCNKVNLFSDTTSTLHSGLYTTLGIRDISLKPSYNSICGFTENEIEKYFHVYVEEIGNKHDVNQCLVKSEMKEWYNGYRFTREPILVYNPISLLYYLDDKDLLKGKDYWIKTQKHPETVMEALIEARVKNKGVILDLKKKYNDDDLFQPIEDISDLQRPGDVVKINLGQISLETILYQNGYLTICEHDATNDLYTLKIPNKEIIGAFEQAIQLALEKEDDYMHLHRQAKKSLQDLNIDLLVGTLNVYIKNHRLMSLVQTTTTGNEGLLKSIFQNLLTLDPLSREPTPEWYFEREFYTLYNSTGKTGIMDFFVETPSYLIIIEGKYGAGEDSMEKAWKEQAGGSGGYVFPSSYSKSEKTRTRLLFNFDNEGIYKWMGAKYDPQGNFVGDLVQSAQKKRRAMLVKSPSSKNYTCHLCTPPKPLASRYNLGRHIKVKHNITDLEKLNQLLY